MLITISWISLGLAFASALYIAIDLFRHRQKMPIMNIVWPVTALYLSVFAIWGYLRFGHPMAKDAPDKKTQPRDRPPEHQSSRRPTWPQVAVAASHCGSGCTIADVIVEFTLFAFAVTVFGSALWASFVFDVLAAWILGVVFQYFSIQPMRHLPPLQGLWAAIKADTLSIAAFQLGMYSWMALVFFVFFPKPHLHPNSPAYWFMMQIAMILGFLTAAPMNKLLIQVGWKEAMG